jgi:hypothetical protein
MLRCNLFLCLSLLCVSAWSEQATLPMTLDGTLFVLACQPQDAETASGGVNQDAHSVAFHQGKMASHVFQKMGIGSVPYRIENTERGLEFHASGTVQQGQEITATYQGAYDGKVLTGTISLTSGKVTLEPPCRFISTKSEKIVSFQEAKYLKYSLSQEKGHIVLAMGDATVTFSGVEMDGFQRASGELQIAGTLGSGLNRSTFGWATFTAQYDNGVCSMTFADQALSLHDGGKTLKVADKSHDLGKGKVHVGIDVGRKKSNLYAGDGKQRLDGHSFAVDMTAMKSGAVKKDVVEFSNGLLVSNGLTAIGAGQLPYSCKGKDQPVRFLALGAKATFTGTVIGDDITGTMVENGPTPTSGVFYQFVGKRINSK